tara:strand:- start:10812 stop:13058 length:2247 start_codon:yes stop_codon:yes gene_type:complete
MMAPGRKTMMKGTFIMTNRYKLLVSCAALGLLVAACGKPKVPTPDVPENIAPTTEGAEMPSGPAEAETTALEAGDAANIVEASLEAPANPADAVIKTPKGPMKVMVVMDSSGSMWGQIDGRSKRDIAREAVRAMVDSNPDLGSAGLIAYGHRRKGDCKDIELMRSPGARVPLADAVDKLVPVGKTPLTAAVETAANALKIEENRATVILVTDGIETCDADPCAAGLSLEERGIDFTTHVIGFGLSADEGRQVACLAEETGGRYIEASNAGELSEALKSVAEAVESGPPEAATATASIDGPETVEIGDSFSVSWDGPGTESDYVDIVPTGYKPTSGELSYGYTRHGNPATLRAPGEPGEYQLRYVWTAPQGRTVLVTRPIIVTDAEVALMAEPTIGIGEPLTVEWRGPDNPSDYVDIVPRGYTRTNGEKAYVYTRDNPDTLTIRVPGTAGAYDLRYVAQAGDGKKVLKTLPLDVTETSVDLAFNPAISLGGVLVVDWSGPGTQGDYIDIVPRGYTLTSGEKSYAYTSGGNPLELALPGEPGKYDVRYVLQSADGRTLLKTVPLTLNDIDFALAPSKASGISGETISVNWTGPGNDGDYVDIVPRGYKQTSGEKTYTYIKADNPLTIRLPGAAGDYDLRYVFASSTGRFVKAVRPIRVTPATVTLDVPSSVTAGANFDVSWTGPGYANDYVDLVPEGHTSTSGELSYAYIKKGETLTLIAPDEAGSFIVRYVLQGPDGRMVVTSKPITVN